MKKIVFVAGILGIALILGGCASKTADLTGSTTDDAESGITSETNSTAEVNAPPVPPEPTRPAS